MKRPAALKRGVYLLPSLFTIANMLMGFYAVIVAVNGHFRQAAWLIFGAALVDSLDGRIARMTGTESDFGREYDSLADVLTFGMAPGLVAWFWGLRELSPYAWGVPAFFTVCCATRLARFNVQTRTADRRFFAGLPAPAAAGCVAAVFFFAPDKDWKTWLGAALLVTMVAVGVLMVSTFRFHSFKNIDLSRRQSYRALLPIAAVMAVIVVSLRWPAAFFLTAAGLYAISGPLGWLFGRFRRPAEAPAAGPGEP